MDEFQPDNNGLLEFINNKCNKSDEIEIKKLIFLYTKSIRLAINNTYNEQKNIQYTLSCSELISNIFMIIYSYSLNIKLTLFICERSILLFNEYLNISKNYGSDKVNLLDVKQFIINKSIGPLNIKKNDSSQILKDSYIIMDIIKEFIYKLFIKKIQEDSEDIYNIDDYLEKTCCILTNSITDIYKLGFLSYINRNLAYILEYNILDIAKEINLLKIKFELFLYSFCKLGNNYKKSKKISNDLIKNNLDLIYEYEDLDDFFTCDTVLQDKAFFVILLNKLQT